MQEDLLRTGPESQRASCKGLVIVERKGEELRSGSKQILWECRTMRTGAMG